MKRIAFPLFAVVVIAALLFLIWAGQPRFSTGNDATYWTRFDLNKLAGLPMLLSFDELLALENFEELLALADKLGNRTKGNAHPRNDHWGMPFQWTKVERAGVLTIRILSAGPNNKYEGGEGDDLWIEVDIDKDGCKGRRWRDRSGILDDY